MYHFLLIPLILFLTYCCNAVDDFTLIRDRLLEQERMNGIPTDKEIRKILAEQQEDGSFRSVDYTDRNQTNWLATYHFGRLLSLGTAWRFGGVEMRGNMQLRSAVIRGLEYWIQAGYEPPGWWYQNIGVPAISLRVLLVMDGGLPRKLLTAFLPELTRPLPSWTLTAQNRNSIAVLRIRRGVVYRDAALLASGCRELAAGIRFAVPGHEGLQADYSYHQHGPQLQFGNYGMAFYQDVSQWAAVLRGTQFAWTPKQLDLVHRFFRDGLRWVLYRDRMDLSGCGRQIAGLEPMRKYTAIRRSSENLCQALPPEKQVLYRDFFTDSTALAGCRYFSCSDFLVFRRKNLYFSVKMSSNRVRGSESVNDENRQSYYMGAGFTQLLRRGNEYEALPPLWNWRQLPGVTAPQDGRSLNSGGGISINRSPLVGGISDGWNGAAMLELQADGFEARKSYLCFDGYFVSIGSGIHSPLNVPVVTTVESCRLAGGVEAETLSGRVQLQAGKQLLRQVRRLRHGKNIYCFPETPDLYCQIEKRRNNWNSVQKHNQLPVAEETLFTLLLDHGVHPQNSGYLILTEMDAGASTSFRCLKTTGPVHAGFDRKNKLALVLFYGPGKVLLPGGDQLEAEQPAAVLIRNDVLIAADPLQKEKVLLFRKNGHSLSVAVPAQGGASAEIRLQSH